MQREWIIAPENDDFCPFYFLLTNGPRLLFRFGLRAPFACSFVLTGVAFAMLLMGYQETLSDAQRVEFTWARCDFPLTFRLICD